MGKTVHRQSDKVFTASYTQQTFYNTTYILPLNSTSSISQNSELSSENSEPPSENSISFNPNYVSFVQPVQQLLRLVLQDTRRVLYLH